MGLVVALFKQEQQVVETLQLQHHRKEITVELVLGQLLLTNGVAGAAAALLR